MIARLYQYLRISRGKMIVWGCFLFPFVLALVLSSVFLPLWVRRLVYSASIQLERIIPSPEHRQTQASSVGVPVVFDQLAISYILLTYLWSCILVESFGIISPRTRRQTKFSVEYRGSHIVRSVSNSRASRLRGNKHGKKIIL